MMQEIKKMVVLQQKFILLTLMPISIAFVNSEKNVKNTTIFTLTYISIFITASHLTDQLKNIITGCTAGNRACQSELYALLSPKMMIVCLRYSKNLEEAEEILQDGFIRVFKCINQFKFAGSFEGWVRKIMVNCALQKLRSQVNLRPVIFLNTEVHDKILEDEIIEIICGKEMIQMVQALSPAYRLVFNLYHFEGYKHREIAAMLGIEEGTSKSNLAQAKKNLQAAMKKNMTIEKIVLNG